MNENSSNHSDQPGSIAASDNQNRPFRKRVQFPSLEQEIANVVCTVPNREEFSPEEITSLFFSKNEFTVMRTDARIISKESHRCGHSKHLNETYSEKSSDAQEKLNLWVIQGHHRRGLERWANKEHGDKRQQDQFQSIMAVLQCQDEMLAKRSGQIDPEKLRKVSHKATRVARHFARMMGKADLFALVNEGKVPEEGSIADESNTQCGKSSQVSQPTTASQQSYESNNTLDDLPLPCVDELKDSTHGKITAQQQSMFRRFGFRRQRSTGNNSNSSQVGGGTKDSPTSASSVKATSTRLVAY